MQFGPLCRWFWERGREGALLDRSAGNEGNQEASGGMRI